jgi:hypothetical protein
MAMGLGVGSEEEIADAEGPLGRGEELEWVNGSGRHARRARRRIRQRVRKRRVLTVEKGRIEARVDELERQNRNHVRLISTLNDQFGGVRAQADGWQEKLEQVLSEMTVGIGAAARGWDAFEKLSEHVADITRGLLVQASEDKKRGRVQLESLVRQDLLVRQVRELQAEVARLSSNGFAQSGNLATRALTERMESVGEATRELARGQEGQVGRLDGISRLVGNGLRELHQVQDGQAIRLGRLERRMQAADGIRAAGTERVHAVAHIQTRIEQVEAELADFKGQLIHGSAHAGRLIAGLQAAEMRLEQSVMAVVSDESRTFRRVSDLGVVVKGLMKEVHRMKELWDLLEPEEAD